MPVNAKNLTSAAEAVLFSVGEPLEIGKLADVLSVDEETCRRTLLNLSASLDERSSGICLLRLGDKYQLSSRTEYADLIRSVLEVKKNAPLSNAAFEVLAVIAYNQPVTKAFVEQVRGVDCSGVISTLCQKRLVEEKADSSFPADRLYTERLRNSYAASVWNLLMNCRNSPKMSLSQKKITKKAKKLTIPT